MKKITALLVVFVLVLGLFAFGSSPMRAQGDAPHWTKGQFWRYYGEAIIDGQRLSAALDLTVVETVSVVVGSASHQTHHCRFDGVLAFGDWVASFTGDTYLRTSDLAVVKVQATAMNNTWEYLFDRPLDGFHFPLVDGQSWTSFVRETNSGWNYFWEFNTSGPETVSVAAGTFSTFVVTGHEGAGTVSKDYYSDTVGFLVKTRGLFMGSPLPHDMDLQSYGHQNGNNFSWFLIVVIIVIVPVGVVVITLVLLNRSQRRALMQPPYRPPAPPPH